MYSMKLYTPHLHITDFIGSNWYLFITISFHSVGIYLFFNCYYEFLLIELQI